MRALPRASVPLSLCGLLLSGSAWGAPCGVPDVDATYPRPNALRVPSNAVLAAHYGAPAEYDGEPVTLTASNGADIPVDASYDQAEGLLRATPRSLLVAGSYTLVWPALRGPATGSGRSKAIDFSVMGVADQTPPTFDGLKSVEWDLAREKDPCTDALEDRFVFDFELGAAGDDTDAGHLAVLVFETEHPRSGPSTPPKQIGIYPMHRTARSASSGRRAAPARAVSQPSRGISSGSSRRAATRRCAPRRSSRPGSRVAPWRGAGLAPARACSSWSGSRGSCGAGEA